MAGTNRRQPPRTVLEKRLRDWRLTQQEFIEYAERFAREHGERATLGVRHLQRLIAGRGPNGAQLGPLLPDTARLLERIFDASVHELLSAPGPNDEESDLRERIRRAHRVDTATLDLLNGQLDNMRRTDRQLGAMVRGDVCLKLRQVTELHRHSVTPQTRIGLAKLTTELSTLAGWQALDAGKLDEAWRHYEQANTAALEVPDPAYRLHAAAEQAFVLLDLGEPATAADRLNQVRNGAKECDPQLRAWLAAAHGEAFATDGQHAASLEVFDDARTLLPDSPSDTAGPYLALNGVHLDRWRGHALARLGNTEAINVLDNALEQLDPTFTRATTALHVDLALAHLHRNERDGARVHAQHAAESADRIGSRRQLRRLQRLTALLQ